MMIWWWHKYDSVYFAVVLVIYDIDVFGEMREQERKVLGFENGKQTSVPNQLKKE